MGSRLRALQVLETRRQTTDRAAQNGLETSVTPHTLIHRHPHRLRIKPAMLRVQQLRRRALRRPLLPRRRRRREQPKSGDDFVQQCPDDGKQYFCRKIYQNVRGDERVIRSCGWIEDERDRECYSTVLEEYNTDVCACKGELCNSATAKSISVIAVLSPMALGYLIH